MFIGSCTEGFAYVVIYTYICFAQSAVTSLSHSHHSQCTQAYVEKNQRSLKKFSSQPPPFCISVTLLST